MTAALPSRPNLSFLKDQAKRLLQAFKEAESEALARFAAHHPRVIGLAPDVIKARSMSLSDAQVVLAREHGFRSWTLLKRFIETQAAASDATTPEVLKEELLEAAGMGDTKLLGEILDAHPALKDTADENQWTLLCHAAHYGHAETVRLLLQRGADPVKEQPIHYAGQRGHREICKMLAEAGGVDGWAGSKDPDEIAAWRCSQSFDVEGLRAVLARNPAPAKAAGRMKRTMLHEAASNGDVEVLKVLLEFGANPDAKDERGETAFSRAAGHRQQGAVELLAGYGAACDLFTAIEFGLFEHVKTLVQRNPEQLQGKDRRGFSVVRLARQHNRKEIAQYLLDKGAEDAEGLTKLWLGGKSVQREDWKGTTFRNVSFKGSVFNDIDMSEVVFQNMNFKGSTFINMNFANVQLDDANIEGMKIYGIEVKPLVMAELAKRHKK